MALLNSIRLSGNEQEVVVLDCGLDRGQRAFLRPHATLVELPAEVAERTLLGKAYLHRVVAPSEIALYVDSDVIVTGSLNPLVELAAAGRIAAAAVDWAEKRARRVEAWGSLLGLLQPLRAGETYVNAGVLALDTARWSRLLERWWEVSLRVPDGSTFRGDIDENPLWAGDQDALNALLMSEVPAGSVHVLSDGTIVFPPDVERVSVRDPRTLACELDGAKVTMLHYSWVPKPWEARAWTRMQHPAKDAYARLLPRVLFADDSPVRIPRRSVQPWLRGGATGAVARRWVALLRPLRRWAGHARRRVLPRRPPVQRPV